MDRLILSEDAMAAQYAALGNLDDVTIDLEVTSVCDAVCNFCPREYMPDKKRFISMELIDRLTAELHRHRVTGVVLCGIGESTLHPQLNEIVRKLADTGAKIEMTTHGGARMDARRFETLVQHGLTGFSFSLNAATAATHQQVMRLKDFDRTVANLREILALRNRAYRDVSIHVSFVVCDVNEHEAMDFVEMWRPYQLIRIWLHPLNNRNTLLTPGVKPASMDRFVRAYAGDPQVIVDVFARVHEDPRVCKIAKTMIFISAEGEMRLCAMDYRRTTSYGNLLHRSLPDMQRVKISKYLHGEMNEFCQGCDFCPSGVRVERSGSRVLPVV
jgi:molybdenum cofactor biosynthesis enzyme MoaA